MSYLKSLLVVLLVLTTLAPTTTVANSFGINLYGMSYHFLRAGQSRKHLNEFNTGIGARASFGSRTTGTLLIEGGTFKDTFENQAKYLGIGYMVRTFKQFRVGVIGAMYTTKSLGRGGTLAVIPVASVTIWRVSVNCAYLPKYKGVNPYHILGAYLTINISEGEPHNRRPQP